MGRSLTTSTEWHVHLGLDDYCQRRNQAIYALVPVEPRPVTDNIHPKQPLNRFISWNLGNGKWTITEVTSWTKRYLLVFKHSNWGHLAIIPQVVSWFINPIIYSYLRATTIVIDLKINLAIVRGPHIVAFFFRKTRRASQHRNIAAHSKKRSSETWSWNRPFKWFKCGRDCLKNSDVHQVVSP